MNWLRFLFVAKLAAIAAVGGCATHIHHAHQQQPLPHGWITVAGPSVPGATVIVDSYGMSLSQCLLESNTTAVIAERLRLRPIPVDTRVELPTPSDLKAIVDLTSRPLAESDVEIRYVELAAGLNALLANFPGVAVPATWSQGWPHYVLDGQPVGPAMSQVIDRVNAMPEGPFKVDAINELIALRNPQLSAAAREASISHLSELARDGKILVRPEEQAMAWSYAAIHAIHQRNKSLFSVAAQLKNSRAEPETVVALETHIQSALRSSAGDTLEELRQQLEERPDPQLEPLVELALQLQSRVAMFEKDVASLQSPVGNLNTNGADPGLAPYNVAYIADEALIVFIQKRSGENYLLPLEMVYESELGGLWLFPGDTVNIVRFKELPACQPVAGGRRIGMVGLIAAEGILLTDEYEVSDILSESSTAIDVRADLLVVTDQWNGAIVHTFFPIQAKSISAAAQSSTNALLGRWTVQDGAIFRFDVVQLNATLLKSKVFQQIATREHAKNLNYLGQAQPPGVAAFCRDHSVSASTARRSSDSLNFSPAEASDAAKRSCSRAVSAAQDAGAAIWDTTIGQWR